MNSSDFNFLSNEANREGRLGDVLQVFIHDFTLRQGAGEAKVRDVERKIGGVTSELFILRKLLQDFQTRVNDDHDIIMRLQHEIEALQSRVRSLDSRHTAVEAQSGRLDLRIEQLRDEINQNCEDTHQNVSRLISNFARANLARNNVRHDSANNNRESVNSDHLRCANLSNDVKTLTEENNKSSSNEVSPAVSNSQFTECSVIPQETTFPNTTTKEVSNEEFCANDEHSTTSDMQAAEQPHSLCNEWTSGEKEGMHENSIDLPENNNPIGDKQGQLMEASDLSISNGIRDENNCNPVKDDDDDDDISLKDDCSLIKDTPNENVNMEMTGKVDESRYTKTLHSTEAEYKFSENNKSDTENCIDLPQSINSPDTESKETKTDVTNNETSQANNSCNNPTTSKPTTEISNAEASQSTGESSCFGKSQGTSKRNKQKKCRGRKRKDSQNTDCQSSLEASTQVPFQANTEKSSKYDNDETQAPTEEQESLASRTSDSFTEDVTAKVKSKGNTQTHCLQDNELYNKSEEKEKESLPQTIKVKQTDHIEDQDNLPYGEASVSKQERPMQKDSAEVESAQGYIVEESAMNPPAKEMTETEVSQQTEETFQRSETKENLESAPVGDPLCMQSESDELCKVQRSLNISAEKSPLFKRRATAHLDIEDDEMPDLSDMDSLVDEMAKLKEKVNEQRSKIEIKTPAGELSDIQPKRPMKREEKRMEAKEEEPKDEVVGMCANCSNLAKLRCGNCRQAFYCKKECQKEHWKSIHKDQCRPFQVLECPELGRYMVASRDLKAGDVILKEEPLVVGPKQMTEPICLGCYKRVDGSYRCQKCHWPLCGPHCEKSPDHLPECVVGMEIGSPIEISNFDEPNHFYEVVFPLRCLALKKKSPKKYEQLMSLDSHYEDRKGTHVYVENQKSIVNMLRNYFFLQQFPIEDIDSSEKSIHSMTGIIDVNALEIRLSESEILGLYPNFAMLEHSCTPNTKHTFVDNRTVVLKAAVDIKRGEHLSTMYTHILWGTLARRDHLKHSKYFMCTCFRCSDPTELGTNFSTIRCKRCTNGFMLSAAPLDELADWLCTSCNETIKNEEVTDINLKLGEEIEKILAAPTVPLLEELLQNHGKTTVHPNHYHLFVTRHTLLQMYGRDPTYANEDYMKKKERMCQDFLKVCTALDPGMSRLAPYVGVALYEYHLAVLSRTRQDPDARQTDPAALKKDVETAKALLQQCIKVLQEEPKDQPEGQLCHVAQQNLIELRQWEANLFST